MAYLRVTVKDSDGKKSLRRFDGFATSSFDSVKSQFLTNYDVEVVKTKMDLTGASYGLPTLKDSCLTFNSNGVSPDGTENNPGPEMMSLEMSEVSQCVMRGTGKDRNLIELQFQDNDNLEKVRPESRKRLYHIYIYIYSRLTLPPSASPNARFARVPTELRPTSPNLLLRPPRSRHGPLRPLPKNHRRRPPRRTPPSLQRQLRHRIHHLRVQERHADEVLEPKREVWDRAL